ncbi:MAG: hypothetical protein JWN03_3860 [Nocardia sp.]|uniref:hemophore-related protein n=1 Tax=Nocardia sp. TaxID=1821 RepID=UPI00260DF65C|nr:hemophore-related protein [Nocardia sp.]MCU1643585.1 hypothetical protein [Nocardia sp.]
MKRTIAAALAGVAGFATIALAVPGVASADAPDCSQAALTAARADAKTKVQAYLSTHPDAQAEFAKIKALPKDQRKAEIQSYKQSHPQDAQALRDARQSVRDFRTACPK